MNARLLVCSLWIVGVAGCSDASPSSSDAASDVVTATDAVTAADVVTVTDVVTATDAARDVVTPADAAVTDVVVRDGSVDAARDATSTDVTVRDVVGDASGCSGEPTRCAPGTAGGACGDVVTDATCVAGAWQCGEGTVPIDQCACVGRPPRGCTCGPSGWDCDAGAVDAGTVDCDRSHGRWIHTTCRRGRHNPRTAGGGYTRPVVDASDGGNACPSMNRDGIDSTPTPL